MNAVLPLMAVRRLDAMDVVSQGWMATCTRPRLSIDGMREALLDGRLDAAEFLANAEHVELLVESDRLANAAFDRMVTQKVESRPRWLRPLLEVVTGGGRDE